MTTTTTPTGLLPSGSVIQVANTMVSAMATGTTVIPSDDTIPQNTEGTEFMTLAFTPKEASSNLRIDVVLNVSPSVSTGVIAALFQDSGANALAASWTFSASANCPTQIVLSTVVPASSVAARTYRVRSGPTAAATLTFNGAVGARYFGGVIASSITVTEIKG